MNILPLKIISNYINILEMSGKKIRLGKMIPGKIIDRYFMQG